MIRPSSTKHNQQKEIRMRINKWTIGLAAAGIISAAGTQTFGDAIVKQAYVMLRVPVGNGLDFKLGHFNYIGGYEYPDAGDNPNYSRSYAWTLEPASHTGLVASYKVNDMLSFMAG